MKKILYLFLLSSLTFSCQKSKENSEATQGSVAFESERNAFFSNLKTAADAAARLQATAADFNASLMNDPLNYTNYTNDPVKSAANLGIYLSDLNYSVAYKQSNTKDLFTAAYELSKVIGIEQSMLDFLMKRYNDNLAQNDSVKSVINELYENSTTGLQGTERERLVGISMAAYQIENLHLALGLIENYPKDMLPTDSRTLILAPVYKLVFDQRSGVETTYGFLNSFADVADPEKNPNYPYYSNAYKELIEVYRRLNIEDKIANNQGVEIMNDAVVAELSEKVNAIRNKVVSF